MRFRLLSLLLICAAVGAPSAFADPAYYFADFPQDVAIADLTIKAPEQRGWKGTPKIFSKAQGRVKIPRGADLKVELLFDGPTHTEALEQLEAPHLVRFSAAKLELNDAQFKHLQKFTDMLSANFDSTLITDKSLRIIGTWKNLIILRLSNTDITGSGFEDLAHCTALKSLSLAGIRLKSGNLIKLKPMAAKLRSLNVSQCNLTPSDAAAIANFTNLGHLDLEGNKLFDNKCLRMLLPLNRITTINLTDTAVDENCLTDLNKFPLLENVIVRARTFYKSGSVKQLRSGPKIHDRAEKTRLPMEMFDPLH